MRILLIPLLAFWMAVALYEYSLDLSATQVRDRLRTAVSRVEASASLHTFKVLQYEPNSGRARAYAVLMVVRNRKAHRIGRLYEFRSPAAAENWSVASRKTMWNEAKGDSPPWVPPYWFH